MNKDPKEQEDMQPSEEHLQAVDIEQNKEVNPSENQETEESISNLITKMEEELKEINDKYLRLYSDFDNFRKRAAKEKMELLKSAGADFALAILPLVDDFERALKAMEKSNDVAAIKEGVQLVYQKFTKVLNQQGVTAMVTNNTPFDSELHEAITKVPASEPQMKGKIVDTVEKGYFIHEKVLRHAKVVIAD